MQKSNVRSPQTDSSSYSPTKPSSNKDSELEEDDIRDDESRLSDWLSEDGSLYVHASLREQSIRLDPDTFTERDDISSCQDDDISEVGSNDISEATATISSQVNNDDIDDSLLNTRSSTTSRDPLQSLDNCSSGESVGRPQKKRLKRTEPMSDEADSDLTDIEEQDSEPSSIDLAELMADAARKGTAKRNAELLNREVVSANSSAFDNSVRPIRPHRQTQPNTSSSLLSLPRKNRSDTKRLRRAEAAADSDDNESSVMDIDDQMNRDRVSQLNKTSGRTPWTSHEDDLLKCGLKRYPPGTRTRWAMIKKKYFSSSNRTPVHIKDRIRTMKKNCIIDENE